MKNYLKKEKENTLEYVDRQPVEWEVVENFSVDLGLDDIVGAEKYRGAKVVIFFLRQKVQIFSSQR